MASNYTINMQPGVIYNDIHDNEVVNLTVADGKVTVGEDQPDKQRGRKKEWLFMDSAGRKDSQLTKAKAKELLEYLADYGAEKAKVECRKDNVTCLTFLAFYHVWAEQGLVRETLNGGAAYRFLKEDCRLTVEHTEKTLSSFLKAHYDRVDQKRIDDVRKVG